ncbi:MAG: hypothetical protein IKQ41_12765 [Clostridia bacterium]|nr:hypothetical protein [Clostridia bacterium]
MEISERLQALAKEKAAILHGDAERVSKQHADGKCTARERALKLFDAGSFMEIDALRENANLVAGCGTVNGQAVYCFAQDFASCGGAMTKDQSKKILKVLGMARMNGAPVVALLDSAGIKLQDGMDAMPVYARILSAMARLSGVCPIISCVMGPCRGLAAMITQLSDINIQVKKNGLLALHTAQVMNSEKGRAKTDEQLFGAETMDAQGACAFTAENEDAALSLIGALIDLLPACNMEDAPLSDSEDLNRLLTVQDANDVGSLLADLADGGQVLELYKGYGPAIRTAFCRVGGRTVGVVANDYAKDGGRLASQDSRKAARFVRLCDCYQIPVVSLVNTDGLAVPLSGHQGALLRGAADLLYAYAEATAPKIAVITGNAVGAAYVAMGGRSIADVSYAWPAAMIAPLTREAAVQTLDGDKLNAGESRAVLEGDYAEQYGALAAAKAGVVDDVIEPRETRKYIIAALEVLATKRDVNLPKKHGNLPL